MRIKIHRMQMTMEDNRTVRHYITFYSTVRPTCKYLHFITGRESKSIVRLYSCCKVSKQTETFVTPVLVKELRNFRSFSRLHRRPNQIYDFEKNAV